MKSSLARILWSVAYLSIAVIGLRFAIDTPPFRVSASPQQDRTVTRKPWRVEPVKVVAVKNRKNANIEIGKAFVDDDDWLDGFTITVINNSDKTVTAVAVEMIFRRDPGDTRPPVAEELHFGPSPMRPEYNLRDPSKVINVGQTGDLQLSPYNYKMMRDLLQQKGYSNSISRVELVIREVGFEDGSMLYSGTFYLQDPAHPGDPTKKIRTPSKPPGVQNHHPGTLKDRKFGPQNKKEVEKHRTFLKLPLEVSEAKIGDRPIALGEQFDGDADWLKGLKVKIKNESDQTITWASISFLFPETRLTGPVMVDQFFLGQRSDMKTKNPPLDLKPGEEMEVSLESHFDSIKHLIESRGRLDLVNDVDIEVQEVMFADGTLYSGDVIWKPNPDTSSPHKWLKVRDFDRP